MMPTDRFERQLPGLLTELAEPRTPDYFDDLLRQTARTSQRPAWSFPERWLPMVDIARQPVLAPRLAWRTIGLGLVLLAVLVAMLAAVLTGTRQRIPAPFGPARNGLVAYASGGDIYTADPLTGVATAVVTGPDTDLAPVWSRDGTHFVFERHDGAAGTSSRLFVARADGTALIPVTPEPRTGLSSYSFSPDGGEIVFISGVEGSQELWLAKADGSGQRRLDVRMSVSEATYRPPDGEEIVFADGTDDSPGDGIYAVNVKSGMVRTIVEPSPEVGLGVVKVGPDGSHVAYSAAAVDPTRNTYRVHVSSLDGTGKQDLILPMPAGATFQDAATWSNDGTRLVIVRGYATFNQDVVLAIVPADGSGPGVETKHGLTGCCDTTIEWAPDDSSILIAPEDVSGQPQQQLILDPLTGASRPAPWAARSDPAWTSDPAWQRLAP